MAATYYEENYRPVAGNHTTRFLRGTNIEIVRELAARQPLRHVLFDFDGTLSLVREGWVDVMLPLMVVAGLPIRR
jgi:hypothetical protein